MGNKGAGTLRMQLVIRLRLLRFSVVFKARSSIGIQLVNSSGFRQCVKFFLLLCLVGLAAASFYDRVIDHHAKRAVDAFREGLDKAGSLKEALGLQYSDEAKVFDTFEAELKIDLLDTLKERLDRVLEKIKDILDHGHKVSHDLLDKAKELRDKLKDLTGDAGSQIKDFLQKLKDGFKEIFDKVTGKQKRDIIALIGNLIERLNLREVLKDLKEKIKANVDIDKIREYVKEKLGNSVIGQDLLERLEKGLDKFRDMVDNWLDMVGEKSSVHRRALQDVAERLKELVGGGREALKEKIVAFLDWFKDVWDKGVENTKDRIQELKDLAKEVAENVHNLRDDAKRQAIEILEPFKQQLGDAWKDMINAIRGSFES